MANDNVQAGAQTGAGPIFATLSDGTNEHPLTALEWVSGGTTNNWTFTKVNATHGLPVEVVAAIPAGTNVIGHAILDTGSTTAATQATASNLNAQVVGNVADAGVNAGNPVLAGATYQLTLPTYTDGQRSTLHTTNKGELLIWLNSALDKTNDAVQAYPRADTVGGASPFHLTGAANSDNATVVKNTPGTLYGFEVFNYNGNVRYLKFYDKATTPSSSDTPVKVIPIPATSGGVTGGVVRSYPLGLAFAAGIGYRIVTGLADSDNTSVTLNDVTLNGEYK